MPRRRRKRTASSSDESEEVELPASASKRQSILDSSSSEEEQESRRVTPPSPRRSPRKAKRRKALDSESEASAESESSEESEASDVFTVASEDEEDESVAEQEAGDSSEDDELVVTSRRNSRRVSVVRDADVGDADSSGDEDIKPSPKLDLQKTARPTLYDSSSDEGDLSDSSPMKSNKLSISPPKICCPSTNDIITDDALDETHVCFVSPDGSSRQCFNLSTLRKIALTNHPQYRENLAGKQVRTFLQPPHFRTALSDDLLDQVASRFGRDALDIDGAYYREPEQDFMPAATQQDAIFQELVDQYVQKVMGSQDVYVCPLCYTVAHHRMISKKPSKYSTEFRYDPLTILGSLDDNEFQSAGGFCFARVADCKMHLKTEHHVDVSFVEGNDLYKRFQVRTTDGLLQRWMKKQGRSKQGHLHQYWFEGNNYLFMQLLEHVQRIADYRVLLKDSRFGDDEEAQAEAEEYILPASAFASSFDADASDLWDVIAGPYGKDEEDLEAFLDDGSASEQSESGFAAYRAFEREDELDDMEDDQKYVEQLQKRFSSGQNNDDTDSESDTGAVDARPQLESSESEDDWLSRRRERKKKQIETKSPGGRLKKRRPRLAISASSEDSDASFGVTQQPARGRKLVLLDDSDVD